MKAATKERTRKAVGFIVMWEFRVARGKRQQFEREYGSDGVWATFFRTGQGYVRTELIRDSEDSQRYLTLDFWTSRRDYERFRKGSAAEYQAIDKRCESLTREEVEIGRFTRPPVRSKHERP